MNLGGMVRELAQHCELISVAGAHLRLRLAPAHKHLTAMPVTTTKLQDALSQHLGSTVRVSIDIGEVVSETLAQRVDGEKRQRHADAVASLESDPFVQELIERFDATLVESTVKPL